MEYPNRLHNEISCLGPQGEARMNHEIQRGHVQKMIESPLVVESQAQRVNKVFDRMLVEMETLRDLSCYDAYRTRIAADLNHLRAGWCTLLQTQGK